MKPVCGLERSYSYIGCEMGPGGRDRTDWVSGRRRPARAAAAAALSGEIRRELPSALHVGTVYVRQYWHSIAASVTYYGTDGSLRPLMGNILAHKLQNVLVIFVLSDWYARRGCLRKTEVES